MTWTLYAIVRECQELKASFGTLFTDQVLSDADSMSVGKIKEHILEIGNKMMVMAACDTKAPLIADVCEV